MKKITIAVMLSGCLVPPEIASAAKVVVGISAIAAPRVDFRLKDFM